MKSAYFVAVIMASVAVGALSSGIIFYENSSLSVTQAIVSPAILGHVAITVQDSNGAIKHYVESDNAIIDSGENCVAKVLFNNRTSGLDNVGSNVCTGAVTQPFSIIGLGTGVAPTTANDIEQLTDLVSPVPTGNGFDLQFGTVSFTNATGGSANTVVIERQYTASGAVNNIQETGLFNSTDVGTNSMFAHNVFTPVSVTSDDTLTIRWTITIN